MLGIISIPLVIVLLFGSLHGFIFGRTNRKSYFSYDIFYTLLIVYIMVLISFACLYFLLSFQGVVLLENGTLKELSPLGRLKHSLYFSGVTLMTVGYGDITPVGWGRLIALIESLIGHILPPAFFLKIWQDRVIGKE